MGLYVSIFSMVCAVFLMQIHKTVIENSSGNCRAFVPKQKLPKMPKISIGHKSEIQNTIS